MLMMNLGVSRTYKFLLSMVVVTSTLLLTNSYKTTSSLMLPLGLSSISPLPSLNVVMATSSSVVSTPWVEVLLLPRTTVTYLVTTPSSSLSISG